MGTTTATENARAGCRIGARRSANTFVAATAATDLYQQPVCQSDPKFAKLDREAKKRRSKCDAEIGAKIREINEGRPVCQAFAYVYENAVKRFGDPFFKGLRISKLLQSKEEYDAAIREFFLRGTAAEFDAFNAQPPSFDRDLSYEEGKGLINAP